MLNGIRPPDPTYQQPTPNTRLCRKCGTLIRNVKGPIGPDGVEGESVWDGVSDYHHLCDPDVGNVKFNHIPSPAGMDLPMRRELIDIIIDGSRGDVRSQQKAVGPSEIGGKCVRRLAMRMDGVESVNRSTDPWPADVGTAIHAQLRRHVEARNVRLGWRRFITESRVFPDAIISGSSDLYDTETCTVIDFKTMGDSAKTNLMKDGPSVGYIQQIQVYGLGFARSGVPVRKVGLFFVPRSGYIRDAQYFEWDFDPSVAQAAIARVYAVGQSLMALKAQHPGVDVWDMVPSDSGNYCTWCPFYDRLALKPTATGCPGHQ